jgi:uncharacterized membrane protein
VALINLSAFQAARTTETVAIKSIPGGRLTAIIAPGFWHRQDPNVQADAPAEKLERAFDAGKST